MSDDRDQWFEAVRALSIRQVTPHGDNLVHQIRVTSKKRNEVLVALSQLVPAYIELVGCVQGIRFDDLEKSAEFLADGLDKYLTLVRIAENDLFTSQSDFKTSIIPEFFLRIAHRYCAEHQLQFEAVGQTDIPIEIAFDLKRKGLIVPRLQRVDFAIVKPVKLEADGHSLSGFCIPLVAAEAKTYFDKNMIAGVVYSVGALKSTFPHCQYFAIGEFADFDLAADTYASSDIDEIFILRMQKRADFRRSGIAKPVSARLLSEIIWRVISAVNSHTRVHEDLKLRIPHGRLIAGNPDL